MRWHRKWGCWVCGFGPYAVAQLIARFPGGEGLALSPDCARLADAFATSMAVRMKEFEPKRLEGIGTMPWAHQVKAFSLAHDLPGFQLQMDMGTGKSLTALALLNHWCGSSPQRGSRVLIVCPKSVIDVWPTEFDKHMTPEFRAKYRVTPLAQRTTVGKSAAADKAEDLAFLNGQVAVAVINYDAVWRPEFARWLHGKEFKAIIYDEHHRAKGYSGRAAKFLGDLMEQADHRLGLTGTPMPHSPLDIFAQYRTLSKDIFGTVWGDFRMRYAVMGGFENKQVVGFQNEADMHARVDCISFRVMKRDVLTLPPVMHEIRHVELCPTARAVYKQMDDDLYAVLADMAKVEAEYERREREVRRQAAGDMGRYSELMRAVDEWRAEQEIGEVTASNALVKILRLLQITSGVVELDDKTLQVIDDSKIKALVDLAEDLPAEEPLVIFSRFTRDIDIVREALAAQGRTCAVLDGRMNQLAEWQRGEFLDIAIQIRAGGAGVDLTRACYAVYFTQTHSLGDYDQSLARLDRPGQTRPVTYYHLISKRTIDEKIYAAHKQKRSVVEYILEGIKATVGA